jgi:Zinc carboxypeptidase
MKNSSLFLIAIILAFCSNAQLNTLFEKSHGRQSPTYPDIIAWWKMVDQQSAYVQMKPMGASDAGFPLHLITVSADGEHNLDRIRARNKRIILVNNGIHPGEPDGIDACMLLVRDILTKKIILPQNIVLAIIPVYNIGGCLNRSIFYRTDQDGPLEKGSRGNSQNLDLNRDFIKCDSKEARSFAEIFHLCDPDILIDNHVSNGADYQHVMTLIASQHNKLGGGMGKFMNQEFEPGLYTLMKERGYDLIPYVNAFGDTPETGWPAFLEGPRYSSGYASLWQSFAFVPETHMLKPYDKRVKATYDMMQCFIQFTSTNSEKISRLRKEARELVKKQTEFPLKWNLDKRVFTERLFKGFEAGKKPSEVSGLPRLFYDKDKPFEKQIKFYNTYQPANLVKKPLAYILPQGWWKVVELLKINKVKMQVLNRDSTLAVEVYQIEDYKSGTKPYESHYIHSEVKVISIQQSITFRKGDYIIYLNQEANRFLVEVLEPMGEDSYFAWNFFDGILGQKEGYSPYVFEDKAAAYLLQHPEIKVKLDDRKATDSIFAKSAAAQLNFVYQQSPYREPGFLRYPVYRLIH